RHGAPPDPHSFPTRRSSDLSKQYIANLTRLLIKLRTERSISFFSNLRSNIRSVKLITYRPAIRITRATIILGILTTTSSVSRSRSDEHTSELQSRENLVCRL